jgi:tRNA (guanine-N7-)-methyltransferase
VPGPRLIAGGPHDRVCASSDGDGAIGLEEPACDPAGMSDAPKPAPRAIRSFVRRGGRTTPAQQRALVELWPRFGLETGGTPLDLDAVFGRQAPRTLEIGFGNGGTLVALAAAHPERDYLGVEVHALTNLRLVRRDAVELLQGAIGDAALDEVLIYFPDPWPKKRHHKRRLMQPDFVALLARRLRPGGRLRLATDWEPYAEWLLAVLGASPAMRNCAADGGYVPRPPVRPETRFERRGTRLGHVVHDLEFERVG